MESYDDHLRQAGDALQALADGPGRAAAEALEQAFGQAGERIEGALSRAAKSGELDFRAMAQSVLADLARIAAEATLARTGAGRAMTVNVAMHGHADTSSGVGTRAELSKAVAQAVAKGGRFW
ncbi:MAG: phage tail tape measure C-terminal domain-containing protein [Henriciella sp.]|uniref:phage tail tape measure C-terminal domain-containing protein n=1 Tax=Henriciella sp. TaxID=1968823 RepID=UPI0032EBEF3D